MMKFNFTRKGDAESFETFRLLVAFVLAAAILVIIMSMIASTQKQAILISNQKLKEGAQSAANSAGTSAKIPFVMTDLMLKGEISKITISNYSGMPKECIAFVYGPGIEQLNANTLKIKAAYLKMDVWAYCGIQAIDDSHELGPSGSDIRFDISNQIDSGICPIYCVFAFNKRLDVLYAPTDSSTIPAGT